MEKLCREADGKLVEASRLEALFKAFPDAKKHVGRWNRVVYCFKSANEQADRYDMQHNCDVAAIFCSMCGHMLKLSMGAYTQIVVGEKHWTSGDVPHVGWRDKIPEKLVVSIETHFKFCKSQRQCPGSSRQRAS